MGVGDGRRYGRVSTADARIALPVAFAKALAMAGATGLIAHSPCDLAPSGPIAVVGVGEEYFAARRCRRRPGCGSCAAPDSPSGRQRRGPCSRSAPSRTPLPIAPSIWPRHCIGLISRPISAACTLCRIRISPVIAVHGEADALHVERDRARRQIGLALGLEAMPARVPAACRSGSAIRRRRR